MKLSSPKPPSVSVRILFSILFFLVFFLNVSSQSNTRSDYPWNHYAIKAMEKHDRNVVAFTRQSACLVNLCVADTVKGRAWFVTQYGHIFDSIAITADRKKQIRISSNEANPFRWFEDSVSQYFPMLADAKEFLRDNGSNLRKASLVQHRLFSLPLIKEASSPLQKLLVIEEYDRAYKGVLMNFNWRVTSKADSYIQDRLNERLKPGSLLIHGTPESGYSEFINAEEFTAIRKARLVHTVGKIRIYDWKDNVVDSFFIKKSGIAALVNEKTDVFVLYNAWLEWKLQQINSYIPRWQYAANYELIKNKGPVFYTDFAYPTSKKAVLTELKKEKKKLEKKIDALTAIDASLFTTIFAIPSYKGNPKSRQWDGSKWIVTSSPLYSDGSTFIRGQKQFELIDHRGNVMATFSDRKNGIDTTNDGIVDVYAADVTSATEYYPFGSIMPGKKYAKDDKYRYGFNGKENDNEAKGEGNQQDYGMRIYDPRIGRFLSVYPLAQSYPWNSTYSYAEGDVIRSIDVDGLEKLIVITNKDKFGRISSVVLKGLRDIQLKEAVDADLKYRNKSDVTQKEIIAITKQEGKKDILSVSNLNSDYRAQIRNAPRDNKLVTDNSMEVPEGAEKGIATDAIYNGQVMRGEGIYDMAKVEAFKSTKTFDLEPPKVLPFEGEFQRNSGYGNGGKVLTQEQRNQPGLSSNEQNISSIGAQIEKQVASFKSQNPNLKNIQVDISIAATDLGIKDAKIVEAGLNRKYNTNAKAFVDKNFKPNNPDEPKYAQYNYYIKIVVSGVK